MITNPRLYEINALVLARRSASNSSTGLDSNILLDDLIQSLGCKGFDYLWLMGVWKRSPEGRLIALEHKGLRDEYTKALPDWSEHDVTGSPYSVYGYEIDPRIGDAETLRNIKASVNRAGMKLILDFVPNHFAIDHPWTRDHPEWFVQPTQGALKAHPDWFFSPDGVTHIAHGKDPYFAPWTDTAQVNIFSTHMREAMIAELLRIAEVADGVRCDMAMLVLNDVFQQTWGEAAKSKSRPSTEFWVEAITRVREIRHDFVFVAESYWGLGPKLHSLGFNYTYDKELYDLLKTSNAAEIANYLLGQVNPDKWVRFIENHDEPRAATAFERRRSQAAAMVTCTLPGMRFIHDGQAEGKRVRLPVQLGREPTEDADVPTNEFYDTLFQVASAPVFKEGDWKLLEPIPAWDGNGSHENFLTWLWTHGGHNALVAVNYSSGTSQCRVKLPYISGSPEQLSMHDGLSDETYIRHCAEIRDAGLYVELAPWKAHILIYEA